MNTTASLPDFAALEQLAKDVAHALQSAPLPSYAYILTLSGELGAGKTTFVQALAREFGVTESVQSPTFVLAKNYETRVAWPKRIVHIDAYRLVGFDALRPLDWNREVQKKDTLILLEWPECVAPITPIPDMTITLTVDQHGGRSATLTTVKEVV